MDSYAKRTFLDETSIGFGYDEEFLPPLWQVIYQEGQRGNHIIFSTDDQLYFEANEAPTHSFSEEVQAEIAEASVSILEAADLDSIKKIVGKLPQKEKHAIFVIYKKMLQSLATYIKSNLH